MRAAYFQGQPSMLLAMTEFGMTVFDSAESPIAIVAITILFTISTKRI